MHEKWNVWVIGNQGLVIFPGRPHLRGLDPPRKFHNFVYQKVPNNKSLFLCCCCCCIIVVFIVTNVCHIIYILCVLKLSNIFRSPMWKKVFLRRPGRKKYAVVYQNKTCSFQIKEVPGFGHNLGCAPYAQSWVVFQNLNFFFFLLYHSAWSLFEVVEDILPFSLNKKQP